MPKQNYEEALRNGEPIEYLGLKFYPIRMRYYTKYQDAKPALLIRQSTLPAAYASLPFLEAIWEREKEYYSQTNEAMGIFSRLRIITGLALNVDPETCVIYEEDKDHKLKGLIVKQEDLVVSVPCARFARIRKLIAEQNGDTLPDESENADIVEAEQAINAMNSPDLVYDEELLVDSVAYNCGKRSCELWDWTIREFSIRKDTIETNKRFEICANAASNGMTKWKNGNPYPHWAYRRQTQSAGLINAQAWKRSLGAAVGEMQQGQLPQK